jgi:hypothetical protein
LYEPVMTTASLRTQNLVMQRPGAAIVQILYRL